MSDGRDPGLQPERTALSWRRTLLAVAVGSVVGARLLPGGAASFAVAVAGLVVVVVLGLAVRRRRHLAADVLAGRAPGSAMPGGAPLAVLAAVVTAGAALGLLLFVS